MVEVSHLSLLLMSGSNTWGLIAQERRGPLNEYKSPIKIIGLFLIFIHGLNIVYNFWTQTFNSEIYVIVEEVEEEPWVVLYQTEMEPLQPDWISARERGLEHLVSFLPLKCLDIQRDFADLPLTIPVKGLSSHKMSLVIWVCLYYLWTWCILSYFCQHPFPFSISFKLSQMLSKCECFRMWPASVI